MEKEKNTWVVGLVDIVSMTLEPFLRKDFGERYFTVLKFVFSGFVFLLYFGIGSLASYTQADFYSRPHYTFSGYGQSNSGLAGLCSFIGLVYIFLILAYFGLGIWELYKNFQRNKNGQRWYTYNSGTSRFLAFQTQVDKRGLTKFFGQNLITPFISQLYFEPIAIFILSLVIFLFTAVSSLFPLGFLGVWFLFGSIFMFIKGQIMYGRVKNQVLNARDSQIEADFMEQVISGELTKPKDSDGLTAVSLRPQTSDAVVQSTQDAIRKAMEKNPNIKKKYSNEVVLEVTKE